MKSSTLLTVPKYVAITPNPSQEEHSATITSPALLALDVLSKPEYEAGHARGKKRRLDHLTWDEKVQRKKLKNRVAAQTSRDRKKAKVEEMEKTIFELTEKAEILQNKCDTLEVINESLMTKNQKLDTQVQDLDKQLKVLQQQIEEQQFKNLTDNICSVYHIPSAEGNGISTRNKRLHETTIKTEEFQRQSSNCSSNEDNNALLALQDLLKDFDVDKFKDFDVEEFAEFLLTGVTEDLERNNAESSNANAESCCKTEQLSRRMVGSTTECMESSRTEQLCNVKSQTSFGTRNICLEQNKIDKKMKQKILNDKTETKLEKLIIKPIDPNIISDPETLYGTYDEKTHSITICLSDGSDPIEEIIEEIGCEEEDETLKIPSINCTSVGSNGCSLMLSNSASNMEEDLDYDPVKEFLCIPSLNEKPRSPFSAISDHGYGSISSPPSSPQEVFKESSVEFNELWNDTFTDLFPSLL